MAGSGGLIPSLSVDPTLVFSDGGLPDLWRRELKIIAGILQRPLIEKIIPAHGRGASDSGI